MLTSKTEPLKQELNTNVKRVPNNLQVRKAQRSYLSEWSLQGSKTKNTSQSHQNRKEISGNKLLILL